MVRYSYSCKDVGFECGYQVNEPTKKDLWAKIKIHNRYAHNQFEISPEWEKKIENAIKETEQ
ncbi:DUF1059 domain-containing protein [Caldiplasma sukawensis]